LSYAGYYGPETNPNNWWEYGQLTKSPSLCTASAPTCAARESNARVRAEQDQVDNANWQARSRGGNVGLANPPNPFGEERGASSWWGKQSIYKDGSARDQDKIRVETMEREQAEKVQAIADAKKAAEIAKNEKIAAEAKKVTEAAEAKKAAADAEAAKKAAEAKKVIEAKKAAADAEAAKKAAEVKKAAAEAKKATEAKAATAKAAAAPPANGLPEGWSEAKDPTSGKKYYYNAQKTAQWDIPTAPAKAVAKAATPAAAPAVAKAATPAATPAAAAPTK